MQGLIFFYICIFFMVRFSISQESESNSFPLADCQNKSFNIETRNSSADQNNFTSDQINDFFQKKKAIYEILNNKEVVDSTDLSLLRKALLFYYDRKSRPISNSSKPIQVKIGISISQINKLDEVYQVMTSTLQLSIRWRDEYLKWNGSLYSNSITFKSSEIWVPDIITSNNVNNFKFDSDNSYQFSPSNNIFDFNERNKYFILVNPNGDCRWVFPLKVLTMCELNQDYFPFDVQECNIDFRSSAFVKDLLVLQKFGAGLHLQLINEAEFDLINSSVIELNHHKSYDVDMGGQVSVVRVTVLMKRKILFYLNKLIMPYFVFYIVILLTYIVPVESGEKKSYSTSILISAMIYLKDVSDLIPKTSLLPMLSFYFNLNLVFIFICLMLTTLIYLIYYNYKSKTPLVGIFKTIVGLSSFAKDEKKLYETHLNQFEIKNIRAKLVMLNKNLFLMNQCISDLENEESPCSVSYEDLMGKDVHHLVKTLKNYIVKNNDLNESENLNLKQKKMFTRENVENSKYLLSLENLKLKLIKSKGSKTKSVQNLSFKNKPLSNSKSLNLIQQLDDYSDRLTNLKKAHAYLETLQSYKSQVKMYTRLIKISKNIHNFTHYLKYNDIRSKKEHIFIHQWKYLAITIDRFIFFFFSILTPISLFIMYLKTIIFY